MEVLLALAPPKPNTTHACGLLQLLLLLLLPQPTTPGRCRPAARTHHTYTTHTLPLLFTRLLIKSAFDLAPQIWCLCRSAPTQWTCWPQQTAPPCGQTCGWCQLTPSMATCRAGPHPSCPPGWSSASALQEARCSTASSKRNTAHSAETARACLSLAVLCLSVHRETAHNCALFVDG